MTIDKTELLNRAPKLILSLLVFLIPLWFLPITQDMVDFQKQALLPFFVLTALLVWLQKTIRQNKLTIKLSWFYVPVLILVLFFLISSLLSTWRYPSFWGLPLNISDSFVTVFFFVIFFFLAVNILKDIKEFFQLFFLFLISSATAGVFAVLQLYQFFIIPFSFAKFANFNTISGVSSVAVLSAVLLPFTMTIAFALNGALKRWLLLLSGLFFVILLLINFFYAWFALAVGLIVIVSFGIKNLEKKMTFGWIYIPITALIISLFFLLSGVSVPGSPSLPIEVFPSGTAQISLLKDTLKQNFLFGSGPGTFVLDFSKYRDASLNKTAFWRNRFSYGPSEILNWILTKGFLGGIALLAVVAMAVFLSFKELLKLKNKNFSWMFGLGLASSFSAIITAQIFSYTNFTLSFLFWLMLAGLTLFFIKVPTTKSSRILGSEAIGKKHQKSISINPSSFFAVIRSSVFLLILILSAVFLFVTAQKYVAEVQYSSGMKLASQSDTDGGISKILSATKINPSIDSYWRDLAQLYISKISQISSDKNITDEQKNQQTQVVALNAVASANKAVAVAPQNVANWNVRGFVYRNLIGVKGADDLAIESYKMAIELEPSSPFSWAEIGRVYLLKAEATQDSEKQQNIKNALDNLNKAIDLKPDYAPAYHLTSLAYNMGGDSDKAILNLQQAVNSDPNNIELALELGITYYQKNQFDGAQIELERARDINPDYSNVRYMLGLVYDKQGQIKKAIAEFSKVAQLNPGNEQIKKVIDNLNSGKPALFGIQFNTSQIQESPF